MVNSIEQVKTIIGSTSVRSQDLDELNEWAEQLKKNITESALVLKEVDNQLENISERVTLADRALKLRKNRTDILHAGAAELKESATRLQEANVQGALNVTQQMAEQSRKAEKMTDETTSVLADAERYRKNTESLLAKSSATVGEAQERNKESLVKINKKLDEFKRYMPNLNLEICGQNVSECSDVCGGAGCGSCGGLSCDMGALTKANQALDVAKKYSTKIKTHKDEADQLLRNVSNMIMLLMKILLLI